MILTSALALVLTATAQPIAREQGGTAIYERALAQCAAFYDPKNPPATDADPFRGEDMFVAINKPPGASPNAVRGFPPSVGHTRLLNGLRVTAKGEIEVGPNGEVFRVRVVSPEDGRFAAFAVGEIAFWRYKPVATSSLCRKITVTIEWKSDK